MAILLKNIRFSRISLAAGLLLCAIFLLPGLVHASTLSKPANNLGLVGYWSFNEGSGTVAGDSSGYGNTGALTNGPVWTTGKLGGALNFDGSNDIVLVGTSGMSATTGTVSAWFKLPVSGVSGLDNNIFCHSVGDDCGSSSRIYINVDAVAPSFQIGLGNNGNINITGYTIPLDTWVEATLTYNSGTYVFYINGVQKQTSTYTGSIVIQPQAGIGCVAVGTCDATSRAFEGSIDEVRVYNRALTATEVAALYQTGQAKFASANDLTRGTTLDQGLVGHWSFDGKDMYQNVADTSGNGNNGYLSNITSTTTTPGPLGQALQFDGTSQYVVSPSVLMQSSGSVAFWFNSSTLVTSGQADGYAHLISYPDLGNSSRVYIVQNGSGIRIRLGGSALTSTLYTIAANTWYHLVLTYTGGAYVLYINGTNAANGSYTGLTSFRSSCQFNIGIYTDTLCGAGNAPKDFFNGSMDDFRIYNRALSASEVQQLYNLGAAKFGVDTASKGGSLTSGLVGYWSFNGADVTDKIYDRIGGNNGYTDGSVATSAMKTIGKVGQALRFNETSDYIRLPDFDYTSSNSFSVSFWFHQLSNSGTLFQYLFSHGTLAAANSLNIYMVESGESPDGDKLTTDLFDASSQPGGHLFVNSIGNDLKWHLYTLTVAPSNINVYVDGVLSAQSSSGGGSFNPTGSIYLGARNDVNSSRLYNGDVDEMRVYNRALSASEVKQLYLAGH